MLSVTTLYKLLGSADTSGHILLRDAKNTEK